MFHIFLHGRDSPKYVCWYVICVWSVLLLRLFCRHESGNCHQFVPFAHMWSLTGGLAGSNECLYQMGAFAFPSQLVFELGFAELLCHFTYYTLMQLPYSNMHVKYPGP